MPGMFFYFRQGVLMHKNSIKCKEILMSPAQNTTKKSEGFSDFEKAVPALLGMMNLALHGVTAPSCAAATRWKSR
jgi:hypothetical protein